MASRGNKHVDRAAMLMVLLLLIPLSLNSQNLKTDSKKIWDQAQHNAFTDLIRFKNTFYCTFREGSGHVPGINGTIRILRSEDGQKWTSTALLKKDGFDLRDPGFSETSDGRLMLLMGGSVYDNGKLLGRTSHVSFFNPLTGGFSDPQPVKFDTGVKTGTNWLWRVKWYKQIAYGVIYSWNDNGSAISLVSSCNGIDYSLVKSFDIEGRPNETALRFLPGGELILLVRREDKNQNGLLGRSKYPYQDWEWINTGFRLGGPNIIIIPSGDIIIGTRTFGKDGSHTGLLGTDTDGRFRQILEFPSGGDTSYPGMVIFKKDLYISYYSSHEGKTSIYFAKVPLKDIKDMLGKSPSSPFR